MFGHCAITWCTDEAGESGLCNPHFAQRAADGGYREPTAWRTMMNESSSARSLWLAARAAAPKPVGPGVDAERAAAERVVEAAVARDSALSAYVPMMAPIEGPDAEYEAAALASATAFEDADVELDAAVDALRRLRAPTSEKEGGSSV
jgi:hypothetical protein